MRRSGPISMVAAPPAPTRTPPSAAIPPGQRRQWFAFHEVAPAGTVGADGRLVSNAARIDIYEEIGGWGVTAAEFAEALRAVDADEVHLHVNSPGGSVFDGLTIFNAIAGHPARFKGFVDGLAASAASFIIQACDDIEMNPGSMMMLHDAIALTWGNAFDHDESAGLLRKVGNSIASVYASRAGKDAAHWAAVMGEKNGQGRWYTAEEAVEAGLADRVATRGHAGQQDGEPLQPADTDPMETFDKSSIAAGHRLVMARRDDALAELQRMPVAANPTCATCGGPWHAVCPSAPKADPNPAPVAWLLKDAQAAANGEPSPFAFLTGSH